MKTCLAKDPDDRWQTARDLTRELKWASESSDFRGGAAAVAVARGTKSRPGLPWLLLGAFVVIVALGAVWWRNSGPSEPTMYFRGPTLFSARDMAVAPNGHTIAATGYEESARKSVIWIYELGSQDAKPLADTEDASFPFWSADGKSLGFFADGKLKKLDLDGGPVQTLCDAPSGRGGTWNKDGVILFTPSGQLGGGLYRIAASGGTPNTSQFTGKKPWGKQPALAHVSCPMESISCIWLSMSRFRATPTLSSWVRWIPKKEDS